MYDKHLNIKMCWLHYLLSHHLPNKNHAKNGVPIIRNSPKIGGSHEVHIATTSINTSVTTTRITIAQTTKVSSCSGGLLSIDVSFSSCFPKICYKFFFINGKRFLGK